MTYTLDLFYVLSTLSTDEFRWFRRINVSQILTYLLINLNVRVFLDVMCEELQYKCG